MKIAFKIEPSAEKNVALHLLTEVGDEDIAFLIFSKSPFKIEGLLSLNFQKNIAPKYYMDDVKNYIDKTTFLHEIKFSSISICYNFSTSTLVPLQYFIEDEKQQILNALFVPDQSRICFQESCNKESIKNIYSVPAIIHNTLIEQYPSSKFIHSTSTQINTNIDTTIYCIFYNASIKVIFFKEGHLQIVQYFDYTTPLDVCYHLLNIAERFDVSPSTINLILSGMIDVSSNLYQEIYKYFIHINLAEMPDVVVAEMFNELPPHFYNHLTALAHAHN